MAQIFQYGVPSSTLHAAALLERWASSGTQMPVQTLTNDASASTKGTVYHLYTTVLKCFEMDKSQKVIVERFGDVTKSGEEQIELKHYSDPLTDSHLNFWKTLHNWMHSDFDEVKYSSLILQTTQDFGSTATIGKWNLSTNSERLSMLAKIHNDAEIRESKRVKTPSGSNRTIPESLKYQRSVCDSSKSAKLARVAERVTIAANSPAINMLYDRLKSQRCQGILTAKQDDFLNSLIGFVASPAIVGEEIWEISYEGFAQKIRELTGQYCRDTRHFPAKHMDVVDQAADQSLAACDERDFVRKIKEIEYLEVIPEAIRDCLAASHTILDEFRSYEVPADAHLRYARDVLAIFTPRYRTALRNAKHVVKDSQDFYDQMVSQPSPPLHDFIDTPIAFRNGILHLQLDDTEKNLKWRLG